MKKDLYQLLDVPENASPTGITRVYEQRVLAVETDPSLSDKQRAARLVELGAAHRVLSNTVRRADYDATRLRDRESAARAAEQRQARRKFMLMVGLPLLAGGGYWVYAQHQRELADQARQREAAEQEARLQEMQRREDARKAALERERLELKALEEQRREQERQAHEAELRGKRYEVDTTTFKSPEQLAREKAAREEAVRRQQQLEELDRNRALLELERQKRFLRESSGQ